MKNGSYFRFEPSKVKFWPLFDHFSEVLEEHKTTTNPQALEIMDFILQDLEKIDQFAHNFELMTHGETKLGCPRFFKFIFLDYQNFEAQSSKIAKIKFEKVLRKIFKKVYKKCQKRSSKKLSNFFFKTLADSLLTATRKTLGSLWSDVSPTPNVRRRFSSLLYNLTKKTYFLCQIRYIH